MSQKSNQTHSSPKDEISITVTCEDNQRTDTFEVSVSSTTLSDLCYLSMAVLASSSSDDEEYCLLKYTPDNSKTLLYSSKDASARTTAATLVQAGLVNGDWILLQSRKRLDLETDAKRLKIQDATSSTAAPTASTAARGVLDFSSLLHTANSNSTAPAASATQTQRLNHHTNNNNNNSLGLIFNLPSVPTTHSSSSSSHANYIHWEGMTLDQALQYNSNPESFIRVLFHNLPQSNTQQNQNNNLLPWEETMLFREFNYYHPILAKKIKELIITSSSSSIAWKEASQLWLQQVQKLSMTQGLQQSLTFATHQEMMLRLQSNPLDEQANAYMGQRYQQETIQHQYEQMMEEYPESMVPVVMLYIHVIVDGNFPIQALVDSGAQMTIMSKACAERCNLLHLVDTRFAGMAVGVGQGKILGRVHMVPLKIGDTHFPCSITVMDGESSTTGSAVVVAGGEEKKNTSQGGGFGDKNVDLLFGLDMLKRHRCKIDLERHCLLFSLHDGKKTMSTPFLHERDLEVRRGGTKDLDVDKMNAEAEQDSNM